MNKLKPSHEKFCQEYFKTGNATKSYIEAGYSKKTAEAGAGQLLRNIKIINRLDELKKEAQKEFKVDQKWLFDGYKELIDMHKEDNPNVVKGAYDSIAKMFGLNEPDKVEHSGSITGFKIEIDE